MDKGKKSLYNSITAIIQTIISGLFGLIITRLVIINYGSDYNGINSTANQFINMLLIVEGGFTLAINVALFKPISDKNINLINTIMSATKKIFFKIGVIFLILGFVGSFIYTFIINSNYEKNIILSIFIMTLVSTSFNLIYAIKYKILLQTDQNEFIINTVNICSTLLSQTIIIVAIFLKCDVLLLRFIIMISAIINSLVITFISKKKYSYLKFDAKPDFKKIKGTKDIFMQHMTGILYSSVPIIFISATVGTSYASIYAVYNNIFLILKGIILSLVNAPRMSLGQLITEKENKYVLNVFYQYEFIVINFMLGFLITASVLIIPFISLYAEGINDIEYKNWYIALLLICITFFEVIHLPSGNIINMAGKFKVSRNIQIFASIILVITMIIFSYFLDFYGILLAVLITAILLAFFEIYYVYKKYFYAQIIPYFVKLILNILLSISLGYIEFILLPPVNGYLHFAFIGLILLSINLCIILLFNLIINRKLVSQIFKRFSPLIKVIRKR